MRNKRCIESWLDCQAIQYGMTSNSVQHRVLQSHGQCCGRTHERHTESRVDLQSGTIPKL